MAEHDTKDTIFSLTNKVVVLTGGSGYLGSAVVSGLLELGAIVASIDTAPFPPSVKLTCPENLHEFMCDLSNTASITTTFASISERLGTIDALVNCAVYGAGYGPKDTAFESITDEIFSIGVDGALGSVFRVTRAVLPYMSKERGGSIVNFGSMYGVVSPDPRIYGQSGQNNPPAYGAGKAAVIQLTRYCAAHLAEKNIRVNCIIPGPFPRLDRINDPNFLKHLEGKTMLGRVGSPKEIVGPVALLCSSASSFMTGTSVTVDGGWTAW